MHVLIKAKRDGWFDQMAPIWRMDGIRLFGGDAWCWDGDAWYTEKEAHGTLIDSKKETTLAGWNLMQYVKQTPYLRYKFHDKFISIQRQKNLNVW